jgi:hypothetical protein
VAVEIFAEAALIDCCRSCECRSSGVMSDKSSPLDGNQLTYRDTVTRHHKALARVKASHDLAAVIAELSLRDLLLHHQSVARVLRTSAFATIASGTIR